MIQSLYVDNFKSLVDFSIDFAETSVIVGNNASGKSTVLQALDFLISSVKEDFSIILERRRWRVENIKYKHATGSRIRFICDIKLGSVDRPTRYKWELVIVTLKEKNEIYVYSERVSCDDEVLIEYSEDKATVIDHHGDMSDIQFPSMVHLHSSMMKLFNDEAHMYHKLRAFIQFLKNSESFEMLSPDEMRLSSRGTVKSIGMSGKELPSFLRQMNDLQKKQFMKKIKRLLGGMVQDVTAKTKGKPGWTQISVEEKYKNKVYMVNSAEMSDGMLRLLAFIAISELETGESVMMLDEVENGINNSYVEELMQILKDMYVKKRHQLIITTHSTIFVDYVDRDAITYLYRTEDGITKALRLNSGEMKNRLEILYPGEVLMNYSHRQILDLLLNNKERVPL